MNMLCGNTVAEIEYDRKQITITISNRYSYGEKRTEVCSLANKFIAGKPVKIKCWGDQQFTLDDLMQTCYDDTERYGRAFMSILDGDALAMKKLAMFHARRIASEYLFEGENLGFSEWRE